MSLTLIQEAVRLERAGKWQPAETLYRQILASEPNHAVAQQLLGQICQRSGRRDEAMQFLRAAVANDPSQPDFHSNLAALLGSMNQFEEAVQSLRQAIALRPGHGPSHHNLGVTLERMGRLPDAEVEYRRATECLPNEGRFHHHLGNVLRKQKLLTEATEAYRAAVRCDPKLIEAWTWLATVTGQRGMIEEAIALSRKAADADPRNPLVHSNLLFALLYDPALSAEQVFQEHVAWATRHEAPISKDIPVHQNDRSPERRLRVGYISADFREHTRVRFVEPVLANHDHGGFEIFCYSDVRRADATTARVRHFADVWHDTSRRSDAKLADLIRSDEIDILVELTGHMGNNRLPTFAHRPAPVQVAYPGYPATTGMRSIDYLFTDVLRDPLGCERYYTEKLIYLEPTSQCYLPGVGQAEVPEVATVPPFIEAGYITFGSLNKPVKANHPEVLCTWSAILKTIPNSRLIVLATERDRHGRPRSVLVEQLIQRGVEPSRIETVASLPRKEYLAFYRTIDIALDPWPYNGHTTTLDALWMGVPVVALQGQTHVSRESSCVLSLLGLHDLIAASAVHYVSIAATLASNWDRLRELRQGLRERMSKSPLCDGQSLTRKVETTYRRIWRKWCSVPSE